MGSTSTMPGHGFTIAGQQREVLAQRVALEVARQVEVAQVGVAGEGDAEHLPGLALVPVGAGVERGSSVPTAPVVVGHVGLERDARPVGAWSAAGRTPGSGCRRRRSRASSASGRASAAGTAASTVGCPSCAPEGRRQPVDGREEVEVACSPSRSRAASAGGGPGVGGDPDPEVAARA